ncbi:MAG: diacylglycerol kinase [Candidatus Paceibacterota bacterium]|jgi:undecaprenol kinase/diacylglycerol kinase (ATP)
MLQQRTRGFAFALSGLALAWREEANFRIEVVCALLALTLSAVLSLSPLEFAVIVLTIAVVLTTEALNTALEELCDKFQPTHDPHIKKIKDLAAAAVLLASFGALVVGACLFLPHLW